MNVLKYAGLQILRCSPASRRIYNPAVSIKKNMYKKRGFDESPSVYFAAAYAVNFFFSRIRADLPVRSRK